jgi:hypothetical protein
MQFFGVTRWDAQSFDQLLVISEEKDGILTYIKNPCIKVAAKNYTY